MILSADDDEDDRLLISRAFEKGVAPKELHFVSDGLEALDYLYRRGNYENPVASPRPDLILLDLNLPALNGREVLKRIKSVPEFKSIPVVVLSTSRSEEDILLSYSLGANSFVTKPETFQLLEKVLESFENYWFKAVTLPRRELA